MMNAHFPGPPSDDQTSPMTTDDKVEIAATFLGSFILGASFAKDFLLHGKFEPRLFFLGVSCFVLFVVIAFIAEIRVRVFDRSRIAPSLTWAVVFIAGNVAAIDLFSHQFLATQLDADIELEAILFLICYGLSTNFLFSLNRAVLLSTLQRKTIYKYLLAPINGLSGGSTVASLVVWASR